MEKIYRTLTENKKKTTIIFQAASITGLGGIGKTELEIKYANDYLDYYDSAIFINYYKKENIETSSKSLAMQLRIRYRIIIFDKAYSSIKDVINCEASRSKNISTLITSRNQDVGEKEQKFIEEEAMDFVNINLSEENEDVKNVIMYSHKSRILRKIGIDVNICNSFKETLLNFATEAGNCNVLNFFFEREEANYKTKYSFEKTPLHCAASACKVEVLKTLIEKRLDYGNADKIVESFCSI